MISERWQSYDPEDTVQDVVYHHNGDYSGDVWIQLPDDAMECMAEGLDQTTVKIPMGLLKDIVARWVKRELKRRLAEADDDMILTSTWHEDRWPQ